MKSAGASSSAPQLSSEDLDPVDLTLFSQSVTTLGGADAPSLGKNAARDVFVWLRQIARDAELSPLGYRLAIEISQHVDRRKGYAHPSHGKLATDLDVSRRGVQNALKQLQDRGHLDVTVSRGAGHANRYRLRLTAGRRAA